MGEKKLEISALAVGYRGRVLIGEITLDLRAGEIVTLIGPNGAGKTTILRSVAGQLRTLGGSVVLCGKDMAAMPRGEVAQKLSALFTDRVRPELMSCREVAAAGRYPYTGRLGILSEEDRRVVSDCLALTGGLELADRPFAAVSDGQRQRVLLARALCQQPQVLLLDEPCTFLDIRYKLELLTALCRLVREQGLAVLMSLHELDLARRVSDRIVCVAEDRVDRVGSPEDCFEPEYLARLFHMTALDYDPCFASLEYSPGPAPFAHYVSAGGKRLRCGYTTGACAALAAAGAARRLLLGAWPETVRLTTPKGVPVEVALEDRREGPGWASCAVRKDGGDDIDSTSGALICARVERNALGEVRIEGGAGVGRVTKPGLDQPVGEAAINRVPRRMIAEAVAKVAELAGEEPGLTVTVSVPEGEAIAAKTFNPQLGIEGGVSILGTTGVVEPMSVSALVDTVRLALRQAAALGHARVILTPGNYGAQAVQREKLDRLGVPAVKCSNFIGEALDAACELGFREILLIGHAGKLVKTAGGIMNTHSRWADCRTELFCAHAALCGADAELCRALMDAVSADACLELLDRAGLREAVTASLLSAIQRHLSRRAAEGCRVGALLFSPRFGPLGATEEARSLLAEWEQNP